MIVSIVGMIIGALVAGFGFYYLKQEKADAESRKIYGIVSGVGSVIFVVMLVKLIFQLAA